MAWPRSKWSYARAPCSLPLLYGGRYRSVIGKAIITVAILGTMALAACETAPPKPTVTIEDTAEVFATVEKIRPVPWSAFDRRFRVLRSWVHWAGCKLPTLRRPVMPMY